jgi:hypothetical protein
MVEVAEILGDGLMLKVGVIEGLGDGVGVPIRVNGEKIRPRPAMGAPRLQTK